MKSILVIDTPSSCSECDITCKELQLDYLSRNSIYDIGQYEKIIKNGKISQCPLMAIDIDELEEAVGIIDDEALTFWDSKELVKAYDTIKSTIDKLKGNK